ncbi:MAG: arginine decarboxylase, partial [Candidatus Puniceispirillaceae bacterium]
MTDIYGIEDWGDGLLRILENGHIGLCHPDRPEAQPTDLLELVQNLGQRGIATPVLIRVTDFLKRRIEEINLSFADAIAEMEYQGSYQGVFPVKVNQQAEVIERIADYGRPYNFGFEVGSKAELLIALSLDLPAEAAIICNGIKDSEFLHLAVSSLKLGFNIFIVLESPRELELVLDVVRAADVRPQLGVRIKLTNTVSGNWAESSGDRSTFGLTIAQIMDVIDTLRAEGYLDCLCLQHSHLGSQVPNIIEIRKSVQEACQFFAELRREGVPLRYLDLGGGLGIDYTGEK